MTHEPEHHVRSVIVGDLKLPPEGTAGGDAAGINPDEKVPMLIELNLRYPGGLAAVRQAFYQLWENFVDRAGGSWPAEPELAGPVQPAVPPRLALVAPKLYQCVLSRATVHDMVEQDRRSARQASQPTVIFRVWPDYTLYPHIDRSAATVKANAGWRSFDARGHGIVWAVIDSGIDASHEHFSALELYKEARGEPLPGGGLTVSCIAISATWSTRTTPAGRLLTEARRRGRAVPGLTDEFGHGTHVSGIIAGCSPQGRQVRVAESEDPDGGYVPRAHVGVLCGMAPACELVSIKVTRRSSWGRWVTSSSAVMKALTYLRTEVNVDPDMLRVHGVNMSLGCGWDPSHYAAGHVAALPGGEPARGRGGGRSDLRGRLRGQPGDRGRRGRGSPGVGHGVGERAGRCPGLIAVGSTHRDAPHAFGITWTSGKGPTLDGRTKPDVVAPVSGSPPPPPANSAPRRDSNPCHRTRPLTSFLTYAEQSGTSMAAPHVSGIIAAFLSAPPEFIGRPQQVKDLLTKALPTSAGTGTPRARAWST